MRLYISKSLKKRIPKEYAENALSYITKTLNIDNVSYQRASMLPVAQNKNLVLMVLVSQKGKSMHFFIIHDGSEIKHEQSGQNKYLGYLLPVDKRNILFKFLPEKIKKEFT